MANEKIYYREGAYFLEEGGTGEGLSILEGFLVSVGEVSGQSPRVYAAHFIRPGSDGETFALLLTEAEAKIVFTYFVGVAGVAVFSTYPRFRLYPMATYRTLGADFLTPSYTSLFSTRLTPFNVTTKAALEGLIVCINNALDRERWLSALQQ